MPKRINIVSLKLVREKSVPYPTALTGPESVAKLAQELLEEKDRENFLTIFLDTKHRPTGCEVSSVGSAAACLVSPAVVFRAALLSAATAVVFCHNHPSGDPTPSLEDIVLTEKLIEAGQLLGVRVVDHLVIGDGHWLSIRELKPALNWS